MSHFTIQKDRCVFGEDHLLSDIQFLTTEKLLVSSEDHIKLYNVEDLSKAPQLQARFILPVSSLYFDFDFSSVFHSTSSCGHLAGPDEQWIWITSPPDQVICLKNAFSFFCHRWSAVFHGYS